MADERVDIVIGAKDLYTQHLKKAEKAFADVGHRLATTFKVGAAALTGYSVALGAMLKTTADAGDAFHKMSMRTGVSSQALSELAHAADLSGSSIETVEAGFRVLSKRMLDAQNGLATAERTFDTLGISTLTATGHLRSADAVFMDAVKSINGLSSETEKAALAQELFGKSGTQLLPLIREGAVGIAEMREEARSLGITFDDVAAARAAKFNDELTRTKGALLGVRNTISLEFLPYVSSIAETINTEFINLRESGEIDRWAKDAAGTAIGTFETIAMGAASMADTLNPIIRGTYSEVQYIWKQYEGLPTWAKEFGLVGLMLGGKKGAVVLGASLHMIGVVKNQMRALEEIGQGTMSLTEFATMNAEELDAKLRALDEKRQGNHPLSLTMGGGGLFDMPDVDTYAGKVAGFFQEVHDRLGKMGAAGGGGAGAPKGGDSGEILDKVLSGSKLAQEKLASLIDPTLSAPEDVFAKAWLGYRANLDALEKYNTEKMSLMVQAGASQADLEAVYTQMTIDNERKKRDFQLTAASETFGGLSNLMQNLTVITGAEGATAFKTMKAFAITQTTIDTYKGAQAAFAALAGIPIVGPALGTAAAAAATVAGLARVNQIASMQPGGSASGSTISAGGAANPSYSGGSPGAYPVPLRTEDTRQVLNVTVNAFALDPSQVNWDDLMEKQIAPALERFSGDRNVTLSIQVAKR